VAHIVGLCGIDGSGKTTVAREVVQTLSRRGIRTRYHHELDFAMGKLLVRLGGFLMGSNRATNMKDTMLFQKEQNRPVISLMYHLLVWLDSLLAFVWFRLTPGVVVHDRWPSDFLLQFKNRGYRNRLIWALFAHFPRPNTLILLQVPPDVAFDRKKNDPGHLHDGQDFFERLAEWMDQIAEKYHYDVKVDASTDVKTVVGKVTAVIEAGAGLPNSTQ
jgi:thymidylate kinase